MSESTNELDAQIARARERLAGEVEALVRKGQIATRIKARCEAALALVSALAVPALVAALALGLTVFVVKRARRPARMEEQETSSIGQASMPMQETWP